MRRHPIRRTFKVTLDCNPTASNDYCAGMLEGIIKAALSTAAMQDNNVIRYDPSVKDSVKVDWWF